MSSCVHILCTLRWTCPGPTSPACPPLTTIWSGRLHFMTCCSVVGTFSLFTPSTGLMTFNGGVQSSCVQLQNEG